MKNRILTLMFVSFLTVLSVSGQNIIKNNPIGTWKFDAPYAPEGYNSGTIVVGFTNMKHTTTMAFSGSEFKYDGENVKAVNDSVLFSIFLQGEDIKVLLKIESDTNMTGKAIYSEGEVPLALSKVLKDSTAVKQ
jgi:hypothetical protein